MKRVRGLTAIPPLLGEYIVELGRPVQKGDYNNFRGNCPDGLKQLQKELIQKQHGLCAYCEWRIGPEGSDNFPVQIEHYITRESCPERELDHTDMLGCCNGGADPNFLERYQESADLRRKENWAHYTTKPIKESLRCGQAKDDSGRKEAKLQVLDPRQFPLTASKSLPNLVRISRTTGEITANEAGCAEVGISINEINQTLTALNLSSAGLRLRRKQLWEKLSQKLPPDVVTVDDVKAQLMPAQDGTLLMFWSTARCYFGGLAEDLLNQDEARAALC